MAMRAFQALRYALVLAAFALASGAQAAPIHPIIYDPPDGNGTVDANGCESVECVITVLTTDVVDTFENTWHLPSPVDGLAAGFEEGGDLSAIEVTMLLDLVSGTGCGDGCGSSEFTAFASLVSLQGACDTAQFQLFADGTTRLTNSCNVFNEGTYAIGAPLPAPEPGSLALIVGGVAAAWAVRRRKPAA